MRLNTQALLDQLKGAEQQAVIASTSAPPVQRRQRDQQAHVDDLLSQLGAPKRSHAPSTSTSEAQRAADVLRGLSRTRTLDQLCADPDARGKVAELKKMQDDLELSLVDERRRIIAEVERALKSLSGTSKTEEARRKAILTERNSDLKKFDSDALRRWDAVASKQRLALERLGVPINDEAIATLTRSLDEADE